MQTTSFFDKRTAGRRFYANPYFLQSNIYNDISLRREYQRKLNHKQPELRFMKTIHYTCSKPCPYPVGKEIGYALEHAREMAATFASIYRTTEGSSINIFCRGSSGAIFSALFVSNLPADLGKYCVVWHIKKDGETSHDDSSLPPKYINSINVIIDDLICTGKTMKAIYSRLDNRHINALILASGSDSQERMEKVCGFVPDYYISATPEL